MRIYQIFVLVLFLSVNYVNAQMDQMVRVNTLTSPDVRERVLGSTKRTTPSICFPEDTCGKRPPDISYWTIKTTNNDSDWFIVSTNSSIRTKAKDVGAHNWGEDLTKFLPLEPYPANVAREASVFYTGIAIAKPEEGISPSGRPLLKPVNPQKVISHSSEAVQIVEGHMYLVRVRDDIHDFYVWLRVDTLVSGQKVTISWTRFPIP